MIDEHLTQFLEHLRYERNVSEHTLRNYQSDLQQFYDHLAPADPQSGNRSEPDLTQIDHLTIREWLAALHSAQKKKSSVARKLAALRTFFQFLVREGVLEFNPAKLVATPRLEKKLPKHLTIEDAIRFIETPDSETDLGRRDLFGPVHGSQYIQPPVRHLDHADVRLLPAAVPGLRLAARDRVEHRRLARLREADDANVHDVRV